MGLLGKLVKLFFQPDDDRRSLKCKYDRYEEFFSFRDDVPKNDRIYRRFSELDSRLKNVENSVSGDGKSEDIMTSKEKGDEFEKFVVFKFDRRYFHLIDWRSDKSFEGIYPESNKYPDLVLDYRPESVRFAVECKWRQNWLNVNSRFYVNWTGGDDEKGERKIETYLQYSHEKRVPVFVVIGVGGIPSAPEELFVSPLEFLKFPKAEKGYLERFRKRNFKESNFYFDCKNCFLK